MMIEVLDSDSREVMDRGIVVGWKRVSNPTILYHVLTRPQLEGYDNPVINCFFENRDGMSELILTIS